MPDTTIDTKDTAILLELSLHRDIVCLDRNQMEHASSAVREKKHKYQLDRRGFKT